MHEPAKYRRERSDPTLLDPSSSSRLPVLPGLAWAPVALALALVAFAPLSSAAGAQGGSEGEAAAAPRPPEGWELSGDAERARPVYDKYCATCHGKEGEGDGVMAKFLDPQPKDFTNREYMATRSDYQLYLAIKKGGAEVGLSDKMAPWERLLSEQEIQDLTVLTRELSHGGGSDGGSSDGGGSDGGGS